MNKRIEELALESGLAYRRSDGRCWIDAGFVDADLERFAELVRQGEREQWTPVDIGVDVTPDGAYVVGMYVLMPEAVRHVFYSQFHPAPKREWVGLTDDEIDSIFVDYGWCISTLYLRVVRSIEAKLKEKNT